MTEELNKDKKFINNFKTILIFTLIGSFFGIFILSSKIYNSSPEKILDFLISIILSILIAFFASAILINWRKEDNGRKKRR